MLKQLGVPAEVVSVFGQSGLRAHGVNHEYLKSQAPILLVGTGLALRGLLRKQQRARAREASQ